MVLWAFYQGAWGIVKGGIMTAILKLVVGDGRGFGKLSRSLITLIPKRADTIEIGDLRPISLVHIFAKLFSKLVANRLRRRLGDLVSTNQSTCVQARCQYDNFLLLRPMARRINSRKEKGVFLKLDLWRAFDSLSWAFLFSRQSEIDWCFMPLHFYLGVHQYLLLHETQYLHESRPYNKKYS
jgi:hypothetical protein